MSLNYTPSKKELKNQSSRNYPFIKNPGTQSNDLDKEKLSEN